jgi:hypothetical protein
MNTRVSFNIFDSVQVKRAQCPQAPNCTLPGRYISNLVADGHGVQLTPFNIKQELLDPWNWDFRPCAGSHAHRLHAGAYAAVTNNQTTVYWIPGAKMSIASTPIPKQQGTQVVRNTDLIFLGGYRAIGHVVYLGRVAASEVGTLQLVAQLHGSENVAKLADALQPNTSYLWRVDAVLPDASTRRGDVWSFETGEAMRCSGAVL